MENYLLQRLRADAKHTLARDRMEAAIPHKGLRGRFREILIDNMLSPWLPPTVACGTGIIIEGNETDPWSRSWSQDDVILYDRSLVPPILASESGSEGVFFYNSVLARIEVKSCVKKEHVEKFVRTSVELSKLRFQVQRGPKKDRKLYGAMNFLFAYRSNLSDRHGSCNEIQRLFRVMRDKGVCLYAGIVSALCVPGHGFWKLYEDSQGRGWHRLDRECAVDHLAWFVAVVSTTCYKQSALRQGRDPGTALRAGIGYFLDTPYKPVECI